MKSIFSFIFLQFFIGNALAQEISILNNKVEPGKTYAICRLMEEVKADKEQAAKVLKFINTEWKLELDTIYRDTFKKEAYQHVLVKEASTKWVYYNKLSRNCLSANPLHCVVLSYIEVPANYLAVYFGEADLFKVVEVERVVRQPMIEFVDEICVDLLVGEDRSRLVLMDEFQNILYIKMLKGFWSEWREVLCSGPRGGGMISLINQIKIKLRDDGFYQGPINNLMDEGLKAALVKFQKEKGLPVGQLDMETLKELGISY